MGSCVKPFLYMFLYIGQNRSNKNLTAKKRTGVNLEKHRFIRQLISQADKASFLPLQADRLARHQEHAYEDVELLDGYQAQYWKLPDSLFQQCPLILQHG